MISCQTKAVDENVATRKVVEYNNSPLESGSLVIVGGGLRDTLIFDQFMELAGGMDAPIVVVADAMADTITTRMVEYQQHYFDSLGATHFTILHTKDHDVANSDEFVKPIKEASGVWFVGGRQWRIVDSYMGTLAQTEFENVLRRGGVIGGSSAGATIQGSYLARGDTKSNTIMMGDHEKGFAYLKNVAIDQHVLRRNRQFDLEEIISAHPQLLGIGIDENTALVVQNDQFKVIGASYVAIYDTRHWQEYAPSDSLVLPHDGKFFFLQPGDVYNFVKREIVPQQNTGD